MTEARFRQLLVLYIGCTLVALAVAFIPGGYSQQLADAYANEPEPFLFRNPWLALGVMIPLLVASVASLVGLFLFKAWSRTLSIYVTLIGYVLVAFFGPTLSSALEDALWGISDLLWGAALALAYFSPIASRFEPTSQPLLTSSP